MGNSSSQPGKAETAMQLELLSSPNASRAKQFYFEKGLSKLDQYHICEAGSGQARFLVKTDLSAAKSPAKKTTLIYEITREEGPTEAATVSQEESGNKRWHIDLASGLECKVTATSIKSRISMNMSFETMPSSSSKDGMRWSLKGDESHQSAVITSESGNRLKAHIERYSRNKGKRFYNPHAYVLTAASEEDLLPLVSFCICLDMYENRDREKEYAREIQRRTSNNIPGSHDADGCGAACF